MAEFVEILISPDGQEVRIDAHGFRGTACEAATRGFEADLGITKGRKLKPEHAQRQGTALKVGGGR